MSPNLRTAALTLCALVAFASNSILTRLALGSGEIDAATFTALRLSSGAIVLMFLVRDRRSLWRVRGSGWREAIALFAYAAPFSYAYLRIGAAAGALVLFGVVQLTMIGYAFSRGERPAVCSKRFQNCVFIDACRLCQRDRTDQDQNTA